MLAGDDLSPRGRLLAGVLALVEGPMPMEALADLFAPRWGGAASVREEIEGLVSSFGWCFIPRRGGLGLSAVFKRQVGGRTGLDPAMSEAVEEARAFVPSGLGSGGGGGGLMDRFRRGSSRREVDDDDDGDV